MEEGVSPPTRARCIRWIAGKVCRAGRSRRTHFWPLVTRDFFLNNFPLTRFAPTSRAKPIMFKRVDRRRKRKEEEENLGLDEDEREVLGLNNTDSSESESGSDSSESSSAQAPSRRSTHSKNKRKRKTSFLPLDKSDDDEDSPSASGSEVDDGEGMAADHLLSIATALKDPIQLIRTHPEAWVCVFCPNKVLKHGAMVKVHEASQARKLQTWAAVMLIVPHRFTDDA